MHAGRKMSFTVQPPIAPMHHRGHLTAWGGPHHLAYRAPAMHPAEAPWCGRGGYHQIPEHYTGAVLPIHSYPSAPLHEVHNKQSYPQHPTVTRYQPRRKGGPPAAAPPAGPVTRVSRERETSAPEGCGAGGEPKLKCQFFLRTGTCAFGNRCKYFHPKGHRPPELNVLGYPLRPGDKPCPFYLKNGWCAFGATCKFHHPPPECQTPPAKMAENQPPQADVQMTHPPPAPYPHNVMGMVNHVWPVMPNVWYTTVCSAPMMPMPPAVPGGPVMEHHSLQGGWRVPKHCKTGQVSSIDYSSQSNIERGGSGEVEVEGVSSESSDGTHADLEESYGAAGNWAAPIRC